MRCFIFLSQYDICRGKRVETAYSWPNECEKLNQKTLPAGTPAATWQVAM